MEARTGAIAALPPLGVLTLAGATPRTWSLSLHEAATVDATLVEAIAAEEPELVGISSLTASAREAYELSDRLRERSLQTVLGGLHVTVCPDEAAAHATAVVVGEGEAVWPQVLDDALRGSLRPRYRDPRAFDLREAPVPLYRLAGTAPRARFTLQTARGCPFACEFCGASRLLGPFRRKPIERVRAELDAIRAIDPRPRIELADDNTFAAGGCHASLLEVLGESGAAWFTEADWRAGENVALRESLAEAGCVQLLIGLESDVRVHDGMGAKRAAPSRVREAILALQEAGVAVVGCHIVGADGEDEASIDRLAERLDESPCADVQVTLETPFPGTALHRRLEAQGRLLRERDWSRYTLFDVTFRPSHLEPEALERKFRELVAATYRPEATRRRERIRKDVRRAARRRAGTPEGAARG